ncbi:MAG TPA: L,D-transpeptidase [Nannocystis sp.]
MQRRRLIEAMGSFLAGVAVAATVYETGLRRPLGAEVAVASEAPAPADPAPAEDPAIAATGEPPPGSETPAGEPAAEPATPADPYTHDARGTFAAFPPIYAAAPEWTPELEAAYPKHGLVTGMAAVVRERTERDAPVLGILRAGARVRAGAELLFGGGCTKGWYKVYPAGYMCVNAGLEVADSPPDDGAIDVPQARVDAAMPYEYWRVSHDGTPFFHRLPSFKEQDQADMAARAWIAERGRALMPTAPSERPKEVPAVVKEYLNAGFYVTVAGEAVKSERRFLRTLRGAFARKYQLEQREGSTFQGILLRGEEDLPVYWVVRETGMMRRAEEGSETLVKVEEPRPSRRSRHPFVRKVTIGTTRYYEDAEGYLMPEYAVGQSYKLKRPPGIGPEERWVHVDLSEQTLVAYIGDRPVFTTLVSTGKEPGMTPVGIHRLQSKHVATSMRDQPVEEDAYSIEDVPWTQYFHNSVALHGAFWHGGFGLVRSHGCVNLSPPDARWLFGFTEPALPEGWHSVTPSAGPFGKGSAVVITE